MGLKPKPPLATARSCGSETQLTLTPLVLVQGFWGQKPHSLIPSMPDQRGAEVPTPMTPVTHSLSGKAGKVLP